MVFIEGLAGADVYAFAATDAFGSVDNRQAVLILNIHFYGRSRTAATFYANTAMYALRGIGYDFGKAEARSKGENSAKRTKIAAERPTEYD